MGLYQFSRELAPGSATVVTDKALVQAGGEYLWEKEMEGVEGKVNKVNPWLFFNWSLYQKKQ